VAFGDEILTRERPGDADFLGDSAGSMHRGHCRDDSGTLDGAGLGRARVGQYGDATLAEAHGQNIIIFII
jgi:hypothetical protein